MFEVFVIKVYDFPNLASFEKSHPIIDNTTESNIQFHNESKGRLAHSGTNADLTNMSPKILCSQIQNEYKPIIKINNETIDDLTDFIGGSGFVSNKNANTRHAFGDT